MKTSKTLLKRVLPMLLSLILIIAMCGTFVGAETVQPQADEFESESIVGEDLEEATEEIEEDTEEITEQDTEEITEEDTEATTQEEIDEPEEAATQEVELQAEESIKNIVLVKCSDADFELTAQYSVSEEDPAADSSEVGETDLIYDKDQGCYVGEFELSDSVDANSITVDIPNIPDGYTLTKDDKNPTKAETGEYIWNFSIDKSEDPEEETITNIVLVKCSDADLELTAQYSVSEEDPAADSSEVGETDLIYDEDQGCYVGEFELSGSVDPNSITVDIPIPDGYTLTADAKNPTKAETDEYIWNFSLDKETPGPDPDPDPVEYEGFAVKKIWKGNVESYALFTLLEDGNEVAKLSLKAADFEVADQEEAEEAAEAEGTDTVVYTTEWNGRFTAKKDHPFSTAHNYTIVESIPNSGNYSMDYTFDYDSGFEVVNTYDPPKQDTMTVFLKKYWVGGVSDYIDVTLYQGQKEYRSYTIDSSYAVDGGTWYYEFTDLPIYDASGNTITYYIKEYPGEGFTASSATVTTENGLKGWKITNTYTGSTNNTTTDSTVTDSAKTGDDNNLMIYVIIILVAAAGVAGVAIYKRRRG